jgi:glutamate carboxypeptidase
VRGFLDAVLKDGERIVEDLRAFVEIESPSDDKASTDRFAEFLRDFLPGRLACRIDIVEQQRFGNHVRMEIGPRDTGTKPIVMLGHFDTVWPLGTLASMPFRVADGRAFGPGAFDMKSGLVLGIEALSTLQDLKELHAPVVFLFTSDEEVGSPSSRALIESEAYRSRATLVLEPAAGRSLKTSRKGVGFFHVQVEGVAAHAGSNPELGASAIEELARIVLDLQALNDPSTGTTVNVGVVSGGTRPNVVPAAAVAEVDLRVRTLVEAQRLEEIILGLPPHNPKTRLTVTGGINRPPMERTSGVATMYEIAKRAGAAIGLDLTEASVGGGSDANFVTPLGVPVMDGLGAVGDGAHAVNEHVLLESLPVRSALIAGLIRELQSQDEVEGEASGS